MFQTVTRMPTRTCHDVILLQMADKMDVIMAVQFQVPNYVTTYPTHAERRFENRYAKFLDNLFVHVLRGLVIAYREKCHREGKKCELPFLTRCANSSLSVQTFFTLFRSTPMPVHTSIDKYRISPTSTLKLSAKESTNGTKS